jgi:ArsR family transcriptional regulator
VYQRENSTGPAACFSGQTLTEVSEKMPRDELVFDVSELFKVLGEPTRARIICALLSSELCVRDIAELLRMSHSAISHQLRVLKQVRIVKGRRSGKTVYYRLADGHIAQIFNVAFKHAADE